MAGEHADIYSDLIITGGLKEDANFKETLLESLLWLLEAVNEIFWLVDDVASVPSLLDRWVKFELFKLLEQEFVVE